MLGHSQLFHFSAVVHRFMYFTVGLI